MNIKFLKLSEDVQIPRYAHKGDAGMDVRSMIDCRLDAGETKLIPTGLKCIIPEGYEIQMRSRSGLSLKEGLVCLNSPGTIDSNYRGEIGVILHNSSNTIRFVNKYDRIAQLVVNELPKVEVLEVTEDEFNNYSTTRGEGGFGSTGK